MNKYYSISFIAMLLVFNGVLLYKNHAQTALLQNTNNNATEISNYVLSLAMQQVKYNCEQLDVHAAKPVLDSAGRKISFKSVVGNGKKLFFRFTPNNCGDCVTAEIASLKKLAGSIGEENIVLLGSYPNSKELEVLKERYKVEFPAYNISITELQENKIEQLNVPYLFTLDSTLMPKNIFIPEKTVPVFSLNYYNIIRENFTTEFFNNTRKNNPQTLVQFKDTIHNFQRIKQNIPVTAYFEFTNAGKAPLVIYNVTTDCGCTVPEWVKAPIGAGKSSAIKVMYDAKSKGAFKKEIIFFSNTPESPVKLHIAGEVVE